MRNDKLIWVAALLLSCVLTACVTGPQQPASDPEPPVASASAQRNAIEKLKVPRRFKDDLLRLYHDDPVERAWGAYQLSKQGAAAAPAVPYLVHLLSDDTEVLMSRYIGGGFHSSDATTPADEAARTLAKIGIPAVDALIARLKDPDPQVRRLAAKALGQTGSMTTVDPLLQAVADPDPRVRAAATIALGSLHHPVVAQKLIDAYPLVQPELQPHLIFAMSLINDIIVVPFLLEQFSSPSVETRSAIVLALGKLRDARAIDTLLVALKDEDEIVRANAAFALSSFYSVTVMDALLGLLDDDIEGVRAAAGESLHALSGMNFGQDKQQWHSWWQQQQQAIQPKDGQKPEKK